MMMVRSKVRQARSRLASEIYTCCAFWIAVSALPALAFSYVVVRISKHLWLKLLSSRYPGLEFIRTDTIRSLLDTHRNQGIINVLLTVKGTLSSANIKEELTNHVIERRDKNGDLMFPRLRHLLVSCWGNYAWDTKVPFTPEHHLILAKGVHKGRPVTDTNIQDYVSEIISKYFPSDQPPWQYIIIPCTGPEPKYHILVRVHHLLLSGKKSINIGDLLFIEQLKQSQAVATSSDSSQQSPLAMLFPTPSAMPELIEKINEILSNAWNEFISEYDPVESPRAHKTLPGVFHVAGLLLISAASAFRELTKKRSPDSSYEGPATATTIIAAMRRECNRRNLTIPKMLLSPLVTADPRKWPKRAMATGLSSIAAVAKFPLRLRDELRAIRDFKNTGQLLYPRTLTWKYAGIAQLWGRASTELGKGLVELYRAPAILWTDMFGANEGKEHVLQTVSLCGRKVAAWSRPVPRAGIERVARALGVSSTDVALYATTEALRAFFEQSQSESPELVLVCARAASEEFLYTFAEGNGKMYKKSQTGGMVCLTLPIGASPRRIASVVTSACKRQGGVARAWDAQARCGALTRAVPSPFARLTLNVLSRRFAVSYAEINAPVNATMRTTTWGQTVESVIYWRPPQANISMSLTVIQYADTVRLAVMTDSRLTPVHTVPATRWTSAIEQLVNKVDQEIARISAQTMENIPKIIRPDEAEDEIERPEDDRSQLEESKSLGMLRPPTTIIESPPPVRRRHIK